MSYIKSDEAEPERAVLGVQERVPHHQEEDSDQRKLSGGEL